MDRREEDVSEQDGAYELESLFIVYHGTQLLMLRDLDLHRLDEAIQAADRSAIEQIKRSIGIVHVDLSLCHRRVNGIVPHQSMFIVAGDGQSVLSVWRHTAPASETDTPHAELHDFVAREDGMHAMRQVLVHPQGQLLVSLDEHGHLFVWHLATSLTIRSLSGMAPLLRYQQLLRKRKYAEAQQWAMQHQLDANMIVHYRLRHYVSVNESSKRVHASAVIAIEQIDTILADLDGHVMTDLCYAITFCIHARAASIDITRRLLSWAQTNVSRLTGHKEAHDVVQTLYDAVRRFGTWQYIHSLCMDSEADASDIDWCRFRQADLARSLRSYLLRGQLNAGDGRVDVPALTMTAFAAELDLTPEQLIRWLDELPPATLLASRLWLQDQIVPWLMSSHAGDVHIFYAWLQQRARAMEQHDHRPHRALALLRIAINTNAWLSLSGTTPNHYLSHATLPDTDHTLYYEQLLDRCYLWYISIALPVLIARRINWHSAFHYENMTRKHHCT
ncbi:hypothetical protein SYNPS1DRAFT_31200 [Syncephalis pseudoplumigaleata]|uniref:Uncharacterized protein n=1 Tax=Syncephalis pseudoplumigaleata TaxID=1712513 RepID=A0A4P9YUM9_9FUNG|nr:hypothetical protein SYNPS1DRAFT_31200 [Syncephalis pseudoplumigaleata]|eukprot:RKP23102.1 hypothetical protein SYNPS1DRAFT_31200 [Syncephalis pseudoplumigaleata]